MLHCKSLNRHQGVVNFKPLSLPMICLAYLGGSPSPMQQCLHALFRPQFCLRLRHNRSLWHPTAAIDCSSNGLTTRDSHWHLHLNLDMAIRVPIKKSVWHNVARLTLGTGLGSAKLGNHQDIAPQHAPNADKPNAQTNQCLPMMLHRRRTKEASSCRTLCKVRKETDSSLAAN